MKSYLKKLFPYTEIEYGEQIVPISSEEINEALETETETLLLQHKAYTEAETAEKGDIVSVSSESPSEKFNKENISVNAGLGLFDKDFENAVIGRNTGETFLAKLGDIEAKITVKSCKRLTVPTLSDTFVKSLKLDGINTVSEFKDYQRTRYLELLRSEYVSYFADGFFSEICEKSEWELDSGEVEGVYLKWMEKEKEREEFHGITVLENYEGERETLAREDSLSFLKFFLADCYISGKDVKNAEFDVSDTELISEIKDRVLQPIIRYIDGKVKVVEEG